jgi:hypothetical protein
VTALLPTLQLQQPAGMQQVLANNHIYNAPRPWVFSQWYLAEDARPVNLGRTLALLLGLGVMGLVLMLVASGGYLRPGTLRSAKPQAAQITSLHSDRQSSLSQHPF